MSSLFTAKSRVILVEWCVAVARALDLEDYILHAGIALFDRYMKLRDICRSEIQGIACAAIHIQCKLHAVFVPMMSDWVYLCDDSYTKEDFVRFEHEILATLEYDIFVDSWMTYYEESDVRDSREARNLLTLLLLTTEFHDVDEKTLVECVRAIVHDTKCDHHDTLARMKAFTKRVADFQYMSCPLESFKVRYADCCCTNLA